LNKPFIIGITGGSASGKTTLINALKNHFASEVCFIRLDEYYKPKDQQPTDENGIENFDTPDSIDIDALIHDLRNLQKGITVERMEYTFNNSSAKPEKIVYQPSPVIIVEGIFVLYYHRLRSLLDFKIYLDAPEFLKIKRRLSRDKTERGYDMEDVLYRYEFHVGPTYQKYIEPLKWEADISIPNIKPFEKVLEMLKVYLNYKIYDQ
jgi:uridine kinase